VPPSCADLSETSLRTMKGVNETHRYVFVHSAPLFQVLIVSWAMPSGARRCQVIPTIRDWGTPGACPQPFMPSLICKKLRRIETSPCLRVPTPPSRPPTPTPTSSHHGVASAAHTPPILTAWGPSCGQFKEAPGSGFLINGFKNRAQF